MTSKCRIVVWLIRSFVCVVHFSRSGSSLKSYYFSFNWSAFTTSHIAPSLCSYPLVGTIKLAIVQLVGVHFHQSVQKTRRSFPSGPRHQVGDCSIGRRSCLSVGANDSALISINWAAFIFICWRNWLGVHFIRSAPSTRWLFNWSALIFICRRN